MSLLAELKRRKVVRVAVVYGATAFAVLQAADIMLPRMGVPDWGMNLVIALIVLGFPIALVLGWALEVTPDGIRRTEAAPAAQGDEGVTPALLGKRTLAVAGLLVVLGIGELRRRNVFRVALFSVVTAWRLAFRACDRIPLNSGSLGWWWCDSYPGLAESAHRCEAMIRARLP